MTPPISSAGTLSSSAALMTSNQGGKHEEDIAGNGRSARTRNCERGSNRHGSPGPGSTGEHSRGNHGHGAQGLGKPAGHADCGHRHYRQRTRGAPGFQHGHARSAGAEPAVRQQRAARGQQLFFGHFHPRDRPDRSHLHGGSWRRPLHRRRVYRQRGGRHHGVA